jgi:hypothetical protein
MTAGRKKYSFFYRIYRRLRYLRYVKKLRRKEKKDYGLIAREGSKEHRTIAKEQLKSDRLAAKQKRIYDKQQEKQAKHNIKQEIEQDLSDNAQHYQAISDEKKFLKISARKYRRKRRKRLTIFFFKVCLRNTGKTIRSMNPARIPVLFKYLGDNRQQIKELLIICIHSTLLFTAAYLLIFLISLLTSAIAGVFFDYRSIVYFNEVFWLVKQDQWYGDAVKMIYSSGPIVAGIIAVFLAIIFTYIHTDKNLTKVFFLWSFIHGFNAFFGSLLIGSIFGKGFGYAIIWSYISDTEKVIYTIISIMALILLGVFTTKSFLISANTYFPELEKNRQRPFIWAQVILPFLLGNILITLVMLPKLLFYEMAVSLALLITIIPIAIAFRYYPALYFEKGIIRIRLSKKVVFYVLAFIFLYRAVLGIGIPM